MSPQYVLPSPPLGSLPRRISSWLKAQFSKEPIGTTALLISIVTILAPFAKDFYYSVVGPDFAAVVEFTPLFKGNDGSIFLRVENYSDIHLQGVKLAIKCDSDTLVEYFSPDTLIIGTINPHSISDKYEISMRARRVGNGKVIINFIPLNKGYCSLVIPLRSPLQA